MQDQVAISEISSIDPPARPKGPGFESRHVLGFGTPFQLVPFQYPKWVVSCRFDWRSIDFYGDEIAAIKSSMPPILCKVSRYGFGDHKPKRFRPLERARSQ